MVNKITEGVSVYQQAMTLRTIKQQQIASNIANADTPNYLAKEFDFSAAMQESIVKSADVTGPIKTDPRHLSIATENAAQANTKYRVPFKNSPDGNTVEIEHEKKEMIENSIQYQLLTQLTSEYFNKLRLAMSSDRS